MQQRNLGKSGLKVSLVGLGCNNFGGDRIDLEASRKILDKALNLGITLIDTADTYRYRGECESILGECLGARRKDIVLATKCGLPMDDAGHLKGASRRYILSAIDASLKRLKTDWIDLYIIHRPDPQTPKAQIRSAAGEKLADILPAKIEVNGHAIQARVYAEDPKNFFPSPGKLNVFRPPTDAGVRVETGFAEGRDVTPHYDPMIAKVIAHAPTREAAIDKLTAALEAFEIQGLKHNIPAVLTILRSEQFRAGDVHTGLIPEVMKKK